MRIYCIPGLANDKRMFQNLVPFLSHKDIVYLEHIPPLHKKESMSSYAQRLSDTIESFDENSLVIGMSLGGIIAVELSKILSFKKVILISTIKHPNEFPWQIKMLKNLPLDKLQFPPWMIKKSIRPIARILGVSNETGIHHLSTQINEANEEHIIWAQYAAGKWDNRLIPNHYIHIHGTHDEIFPLQYVRPTHIIQGGNHYMIMDRAEEIAQIINKESDLSL